MGEPWIKMRIGLADDPAVISIACATRLPPDHVVGKLHRLWSWADLNTSDGRLEGVPREWIDEFLRKKGFAEAMANVQPEPWLLIDDYGVTIPKFHTHNGSSAKSRAENTRRQQVSRQICDTGATKARPEGDKRESRVRPSTIDHKDACSSESNSTLILDKVAADAEKISRHLKPQNDADKRLIVKVCFLSALAKFPEAAMWDALEAVKTAGKGANRMAYWRSCLNEQFAKLDLDFPALLRETLVPRESLSWCEPLRRDRAKRESHT